MKIVSLLPSATEIVFALGMGDALEGVTDECDFPDEATKKPVVSRSNLSPGLRRPEDIDSAVREQMRTKQPLYELDEAAIARIQPDLILTQDLCRVCAVPAGHVDEALAKLGCEAEVVSLDPKTLDDVLDSITQVGAALDQKDRAAQMTTEARARIDTVKKESLRLPSIRVLAMEWSNPPWAAGHWIPQMVELSGGTNLLGEKGKPSQEVTWKEISDALPEVIVFMPCGYYLEDAEEEARSLFEHPDFAATPAARNRDVFAVDASAYFSRPGPRVVDGLEIIAWAVHPDAYLEPAAGVTRIAR
jgi:iron complex transport system substrate-binding protein